MNKKFGRVLSRESTEEEKNKKVYNETSLTWNNSVIFYEFLYSVLHLQKEEDWSATECQECIKFLSTSINPALKKGAKLAFLERAPEEQVKA